MEMASGLERVGEGIVGPSSNKKIVSCPPAGWAKKGLLELFFCFPIFIFFFLFFKKTFPLYILVYKK